MISLQAIRSRARALKIELIALALAARHPQTPWYTKLVVAGCVAYALTPVDFIPAPVLADCRARSHDIEARAPKLSRTAWVLIALAWITVIVLTALWTL